MKKVLMLSAFVLLGSALACPAKKGYILGGASVAPAGLAPECGVAWKAFKGGAGGGYRFAELFVIKSGYGSSIGTFLSSKLNTLGYINILTKDISSGKQFGYVTASGKVLIVQMMYLGGNSYVALLGK